MKDTHEEQMQKLLAENRHKTAQYRAKVNEKSELQKQFKSLEGQLAEEIRHRKEGEEEITVLKLLNEAAGKEVSSDKVDNATSPSMSRILGKLLGNHKTKVEMEKQQGDVKALVEECERLKASLKEKHEARVQELKATDCKKDQELQFRKRIADLLQHLAGSEERAERYRQEIKHLEQDIQHKSRQIAASKVEISSLSSRLQFAETKLSESQSSNFQLRKELEEQKDSLQKLELKKTANEEMLEKLQSEAKDLSSLLSEEKEKRKILEEKANVTEFVMKSVLEKEFEARLTAEKESFQETLKEMQENYESHLEELRRTNSTEIENKENQMEMLHSQIQQMMKCESEEVSCLRMLLEEKDVSIKNLEIDVKTQAENSEQLHVKLQMYENKMKSMEEDLKLSQTELLEACSKLEKDRVDLMRRHQVELEEQAKDINENWQKKLNSNGKDSSAPELSKKENEEFSEDIQSADSKNVTSQEQSYNDRNTELRKQLEDLKRFYEDYISELESSNREHFENIIREKEMLFQKKEENLCLNYQAQLQAQTESQKQALEKIKMDVEQHWNEEKVKLQRKFADQITSIKEELYAEKLRALDEQTQIYRAEIKTLKLELSGSFLEENQKEGSTPLRLRQMQKELFIENGKVSELLDHTDQLQKEIESLTNELELKRNEVLRVRTEATQQIRNLESYWQERLIRELRKATHSFEQERRKLNADFAKGQRLLKDKILLLQSLLQKSEGSLSCRGSLPEDVETIKLLQNAIVDKDSLIYNLKEEKKILQFELLSRETDTSKVYSSQPVVNSFDCLLNSKKNSQLERPLLTPQLVRRHSLLSPSESLWRARSQTSFAPTESLQSLVPESKRKVRHRASWAGESFQDFTQGNLVAFSSRENDSEVDSCPNLNIPNLSDIAASNNTTPDIIANHICDTIAECDELLLSLEEDEKLNNLCTRKDQRSKLEKWEKGPILESEI